MIYIEFERERLKEEIGSEKHSWAEKKCSGRSNVEVAREKKRCSRFTMSDTESVKNTALLTGQEQKEKIFVVCQRNQKERETDWFSQEAHSKQVLLSKNPQISPILSENLYRALMLLKKFKCFKKPKAVGRERW